MTQRRAGRLFSLGLSLGLAIGLPLGAAITAWLGGPLYRRLERMGEGRRQTDVDLLL